MLDEALEALASAVGLENRVVLVRGTPSEVIDKLGSLAILMASHSIGIHPVEDERLLQTSH